MQKDMKSMLASLAAGSLFATLGFAQSPQYKLTQ